MPITQDEKIRWTIADLELFPNNGNCYEIINGDLHVTRAPHWRHQQVCSRICHELDVWSLSTGLGQASLGTGVIFSEADNVIPDVVWASNDRLAILLDEAGHLTGAPELVVEVLSDGRDNEQRDRETKLKLYSSQGAQEYWIVDWRLQSIAVYRREKAMLVLTHTLLRDDELTSLLLPGFIVPIALLFV